MSVYQTKVIILRTRNLGEADRILVLLSEDHGKFEAVAKGARRQRSRFVGNTLPFNYLQVQLFSGKNLEQLSQAEVIHPFTVLREDLVKMAYASYWVDLVDSFFPEQEGAGEVFRFLLAAFITLERTAVPQLLNLAFQARLLNYLGYQPELDTCVNCHSSESLNFFSVAGGGVLCRHCAATNGNLIMIQQRELVQLAQLQTTDIRQLGLLQITSESQQTLDRILRSFIEYRLDRPLKSQVFLDQILH